MSIFRSIGRLTYKTQKVVTSTVSDPIKDFTTGYKEVKAHEAKMKGITKALLEEGVKVTPNTFKAESSDNKFKQQLQADTNLINQCKERIFGSRGPVQTEMDI